LFFRISTRSGTFVYRDGIESTNNVGKRAIRRVVMIRKTSFGSQSEHGFLFLERVLTAQATLRHKAHDFITDTCRDHTLELKLPSLLSV
jgi:transposase